MMSDANWTCRCGAFAMRVDGLPGSGVPAVCYCADCRAFARLHGDGETLDQAGGVVLQSTTADRIVILKGSEHLACERLTARGPFRWFVGCCDTPVGNGAPMRGVPFFSVIAARLAGTPPRPVARLHRGGATGKVPRPRGSTYAFILGVARRVAASRLSGRWRDTPFFNSNGNPVAEPHMPDPEKLRAAYGSRR
ncbi:DUF6151 family protein [Palleronia sp. LCG004]|uniref:DUF6151 family protein n=1 Tax=Palleronia sp. LCG004 TaxID=3079304 RepID=UPI002942932E|nr:DUF6151 family protein [Palleronia sp. LCG004]WOI57415.1 DUF6151 family protein [Palleronia sp. LCG004]